MFAKYLVDGDDELVVVQVEPVYVRLAVEAPVHDEFDFAVSQDVQLLHKGVHRLHVGDIAGQLAVIGGQP